jgi:hypothetical protein
VESDVVRHEENESESGVSALLADEEETSPTRKKKHVRPGGASETDEPV